MSGWSQLYHTFRSGLAITSRANTPGFALAANPDYRPLAGPVSRGPGTVYGRRIMGWAASFLAKFLEFDQKWHKFKKLLKLTPISIDGYVYKLVLSGAIALAQG